MVGCINEYVDVFADAKQEEQKIRIFTVVRISELRIAEPLSSI